MAENNIPVPVENSHFVSMPQKTLLHNPERRKEYDQLLEHLKECGPLPDKYEGPIEYLNRLRAEGEAAKRLEEERRWKRHVAWRDIKIAVSVLIGAPLLGIPLLWAISVFDLPHRKLSPEELDKLKEPMFAVSEWVSAWLPDEDVRIEARGGNHLRALIFQWHTAAMASDMAQ